MQYFFTSKLGATRFELADGSLLCKDVPIARTGEQVYHYSELPNHLIPDDDGLIIVERSPEEVFRLETISSYEGSTFVVLHPDEDVNPSNWEDVGKGHNQNVRQGEGDLSEFLIADIIVKSAEAIAQINQGVEEISCGYDAEYISLGKGRAKQVSMIGNHTALVPEGRAGKRCKIGDQKPMAIKNTQGWLSKLLTSARTNDAAGVISALEESKVLDEKPELEKDEVTEKEPTKDSEALTAEAVRKIVLDILAEHKKTTDSEEKDKTEDQDGSESEKKNTTDAAYTQDSLSRADILVSGINLPKGMKDREFKREVLTMLSRTTDGADLLNKLIGNRTLKTLDANTIDTVFMSASEIKKAANSSKSQQAAKTTDSAAITDPNKLNEFYANYYKGNQ